MTVSSQTNVVQYNGNGATVTWPTTFRFFKNADLVVTKRSVAGVTTLLTLNTDYSVTGANALSGGNVITTNALAAGELLTIARVLTVQQLTDLRNQGDYFAEIHEDVFDYLTMLIQQTGESDSRALRHPRDSEHYQAEARRIVNMEDPVDGQDATTKNWVSSYFGALIDGATGLINTTTGILYDAGTLFDYLRFGVSRSVDSIASLRLLSPARNQRAFVMGYYAPGDGGGGAYFLDSTDTTSADNGGNIIVGSGGSRWKLSQTGAISAKQFGAKGDGINNDSVPINAALATGRLIYCPAGSYRFLGTVTMSQGGGLQGDGEKTQFVRGFTGGQMIRHPGGNQLGSPIILRDFCITKELSIVVANGDTGIDIGYSSAWGGRGDISNIIIIYQWDGFKWKGGTMNPITNVQVHEGKGNGFLGIDARGELVSCLAQYNAGHGFFFYAQNQNETGIQLTSTGTFGNQGYGYLFDAASGVIGANIYMKGVSSSTDGIGGIGFVKEYRQIWMTQILIESAGDAYIPYPSFVVHNDAKGLYIVGGCQQIAGSDIFIQTCRSSGIYMDSVQRCALSNLTVIGNGTGGLGGEHAVGVNFNSGVIDTLITNLIANYGGAQTVDIASANVNNQVDIAGADFRNYSGLAAATGIRFTTVARTSASSTVPSGSTVLLPPYYDYLDVSGTTSISSITASWRGRKVVLRFLAACTVVDGGGSGGGSGGGNLQLAGNLTANTGTTLTLICDGSYWSEMSRSIV